MSDIPSIYPAYSSIDPYSTYDHPNIAPITYDSDHHYHDLDHHHHDLDHHYHDLDHHHHDVGHYHDIPHFHDDHDIDHFTDNHHSSFHGEPHGDPHGRPLEHNLPNQQSSSEEQGDSQEMPGPSTSPTYRRVGKHRRRRSTRPQIEYDYYYNFIFDELSNQVFFFFSNRFINIGELVFKFLGVDTEGCRRRFVCELDFRAQTNPITRLAFSFIG